MIAAVARLLDGVRAPVLRVAIATSPRLRRAAQSRAYRLELFAVLGLCGALLGALIAPALLFVWGPLVLGVPHVVADVRYLVLQPGGLRMRDLAIAAPLVASIWLPTPAVGGLAALIAIALTPRRSARWFLTFAVAGSLWIAAVASPTIATYVLLHGHNVVAIGIAGAILVRGRAGFTLIAGAAVGASLILAGAFDPLAVALPSQISTYVLPDDIAWSPLACARISLAFVFLQGLHYVTWLRLVPEAQRARAGMRGFVSGLRALEADFSRVGVVCLAVLATSLIAIGAFDDLWARAIYLSLASFHAFLELAFLGRYLAKR